MYNGAQGLHAQGCGHFCRAVVDQSARRQQTALPDMRCQFRRWRRRLYACRLKRTLDNRNFEDAAFDLLRRSSQRVPCERPMVKMTSKRPAAKERERLETALGGENCRGRAQITTRVRLWDFASFKSQLAATIRLRAKFGANYFVLRRLALGPESHFSMREMGLVRDAHPLSSEAVPE